MGNMKVEKLRFGCKDFEERGRLYKLLAQIYVAGEEMKKPLTQRQLLSIGEDVGGLKLTENTLRIYIKKERNNP